MIEVTTEDGVKLKPGDRAYDYYTMKPGNLPLDRSDYTYAPDLWFEFKHDDGTSCLLNGQRICSMEYAIRRGFKGAA